MKDRVRSRRPARRGFRVVKPQVLGELAALDRERDRFFTLALDMLCIAGVDGYFKKINPAFTATLGFSEEELLGSPFLDFIHPDDVARTLAEIEKLKSGEHTLQFENRYRCKDGSYKWLSWRAVPNPDPGLIYAIARDVTARKSHEEEIELHNRELERRVAERTKELADLVVRLEEEVRSRTLAQMEAQKQLERVNALHRIDMAILGSVDLRVSLAVFLDQVTEQLKVDAASVLLPSAASGALEYAAGRGFRTESIRRTQVPMAKGLAGRAALDRSRVETRDLPREEEFCRKELAEAEGFVTYIGVALCAKGKLLGVLEIFHRSRLEPDSEWYEYLDTLAGQAAIAIDGSTMLMQLERANAELQQAYDATLEGWVRALDLRDHETEGHTLRVTELTVQLARRMGVPEAELVHIRRGALLHDIGKIGVPDHILLKPGKLSGEELLIMQKHPVYAYEWLSPIRYLQPALDIPYCHHERWDGSGYPRRLAGEEIPLAARIFAVVDVWDALRSDRPYRAGWPAATVLAHIQDGAGTHFDPAVVEAFVEMISEIEPDALGLTA